LDEAQATTDTCLPDGLSFSSCDLDLVYGHREVLIRGYVERVVISCAAEVIARHQRSYERENLVFDPLHYLALIERKVGALDQAAPLKQRDLPEAFAAALKLGTIGFDAVKHLLLCRIERRPPRLDLDVYPYLPKTRVKTTSA
jgi:hypothetical protein